MCNGRSLNLQRGAHDPCDGSPGRTREHGRGCMLFLLPGRQQSQRNGKTRAKQSTPRPLRAPVFARRIIFDPLEIDRDNRDNRDKSRKPLQRKASQLSIMPNEPGHSRDKPGHSFAGRVTASHPSRFRRQKSALATRRPGLPGCRKSFPICPRRCAGRDHSAAAGNPRSAAIVRGSGHSCGSP